MNNPSIFSLNKDLRQAKEELRILMEENLALLAKNQTLEVERYAAIRELDKTIKHSEELFKSLTSMEYDGKIILERRK